MGYGMAWSIFDFFVKDGPGWGLSQKPSPGGLSWLVMGGSTVLTELAPHHLVHGSHLNHCEMR